MATAKLVKELHDFRGNAALYQLDPPLTESSWSDDDSPASHEYVIVSAVRLPILTTMYGGASTKTYIFPATPEGEIAEWAELPGSMKNTLSHAEALSEAGYTIEEAAHAD